MRESAWGTRREEFPRRHPAASLSRSLATTSHLPPPPSLPFFIFFCSSFHQIVLNQPISGLGAKGDLATVPLGYFRNFLAPTRAASVATAGILRQADKAKEDEIRKAAEVKTKAGAMKTALATIGKFVIKKKAGEGDVIFGAVTTAEVVAAIEQQTGRVLDKKALTLPDIKALGTYDVTVRLHPEVMGEFKVVVQKEKAA